VCRMLHASNRYEGSALAILPMDISTRTFVASQEVCGMEPAISMLRSSYVLRYASLNCNHMVSPRIVAYMDRLPDVQLLGFSWSDGDLISR